MNPRNRTWSQQPRRAASDCKDSRRGPSPAKTNKEFGIFAWAKARNKSCGRFQGWSFAQKRITDVSRPAPHEVRTASRSTRADCAIHQSLSTTNGTRVTRSSGIPSERIKSHVPVEGATTWLASRYKRGQNMCFIGRFQLLESRGARDVASVPKRKAEPESLLAK